MRTLWYNTPLFVICTTVDIFAVKCERVVIHKKKRRHKESAYMTIPSITVIIRFRRSKGRLSGARDSLSPRLFANGNLLYTIIMRGGKGKRRKRKEKKERKKVLTLCDVWQKYSEVRGNPAKVDKSIYIFPPRHYERIPHPAESNVPPMLLPLRYNVIR